MVVMLDRESSGELKNPLQHISSPHARIRKKIPLPFTMQFATIFAIAGLLGSAVAAVPAGNVQKRSVEERSMDLFKSTIDDHMSGGEILKRQSAACWLCLASCGFGDGLNCGCCSPGRACESDCPE
ncbi:hypothetical protein M409DRAFT_27455 [Zasmidium cellare ATCC 36951]|uniref:Uncharacterized protein n=1 Tax=Zasmidium cellare ATCC 36951 TaxID=1080233 RepID=A0A6A6C4J0_ZASCE|nr:uncharacterized protein M409DRAFT_27455 [Zasmidium cellare ATCC 36951]KAF2162077.1 hypothetical protein M409DRAFT_27455 [Zasmidium cellare ATCC 36951]